jgi:Xaa-Pro aminopeptidase
MIVSKEFKNRRNQLMSKMPYNSIAILTAAPEKSRNKDVLYPYRQDSDFFYLTGFQEPDAMVILITGKKNNQYLMFCRGRNIKKEIWDGRRVGPDGAKKKYGASEAFTVDSIEEILPKILDDRGKIYYSMGKNPFFDEILVRHVKAKRGNAGSTSIPSDLFANLDNLLHEMRLFKSSVEQKIMKKAATISALAHRRAMKSCMPGMYEYQLQAEIEYEFTVAGASFPAYGSIVGGGDNGCILHYVENSSKLKDGDLVLIDAGCELQNYAADITRTFPINGKFTPEQKMIYDIVLEAQIAGIDACLAGNQWNEPHNATVNIITQGLLDLGIMKGSFNEAVEKKTYTDFYMHRAGHWLGMDVHDVGDYKLNEQWRTFQPGMVTTIEPGIYISPDNKNVDECWRGIGIRIEDDVLVTEGVPNTLSSDAPKTISEIEAIMASS